jgi:predicted nucleic acid-binding protein
MKKSTKPSTACSALVDTSGFYALLVKRDPTHAQATKRLAQAAESRQRFVTTDYILSETATLLRARGQGHLAKALFQTVFGSSACRVEWMEPERFKETIGFFLKRHDKLWSFTDCFSFVVMRELAIKDALTTDAHFRQAGFNALLV